ncbi:MAG TPA: hypothetical protein VFX89_22930 [Gammaproteobacteria bacterium]|nr:hypothetical protein [Gammaproteobacteria bacterium]
MPAISALSGAAMAEGQIQSAIAMSVPEAHEWALSQQQIEVFDTWLRAHRKGWRANLATPPAAALSVRVKQSDGTERSIAFFDQPGWSSSVISRGRIASFSVAEVGELRRQLGEPGGK